MSWVMSIKAAMISLQTEGKIRHIALSNVTPPQVADALSRTPIVAVSNLYNAMQGEARLGASPYAATEGQEAIVDLCAERGIAFLPFFSLAIPGRKLENAALSGATCCDGSGAFASTRCSSAFASTAV